MKSIALVLFLAAATAVAAPRATPALIPAPASMQMQSGAFKLNAATRVVADGAEAGDVAEGFAQRMRRVSGYSLPIDSTTRPSRAANRIVISIRTNAGLPDESYELSVSPHQVLLVASTPAGAFRAVQTLLQLLPKEVEATATAKNVAWTIPALTIHDAPRFAWRGLMLDVSRHFFTVDEVKGFIDQMAKYKFNVLHWHLSDDEGWRIEIKSLPKLTEVGAWRPVKTGQFRQMSVPAPDEPHDYGGFYTQDQVRDIVAYAKSRHIEILPEIDMPGHSLAAIASYPELACTPGTYTVNAGEPMLAWQPGGFRALVDNNLCPAKEGTFEFVDKVVAEVAALFPFEYLHLGGDEAARNFWEKSEAIQALMAREQLKDLDAVQAYFVARAQKIVNAHGKKMIGWDEILQGGLVPGAAVMSWRGMKGGIEAARLGHEVVMSPTDYAYLDYMQGDAAIEPPVYSTLRLSKAYAFDPLPEDVDPQLIKGGQANLWTEHVYNIRHLQYMVWPRALAIAEALWSPKAARDWAGFVPRVEAHFGRLDAAQVKYAPSLYDPFFKPSLKDDGSLVIQMDTEVDGLSLYYSFDGSFPDAFYPRYTAPLAVPKDAVVLKVISYRDGKPLGRMMTVPIADLRKRATAKR